MAAGGGWIPSGGLGLGLESPPLRAFTLGTTSGLSLPLGAWLGTRLSPAPDTMCAGMMAFGAGALLFAVTVELYGHSLHELARERISRVEMCVTVAGALVGAVVYIAANQKLEESFVAASWQSAGADPPASGNESAVPDSPLGTARMWVQERAIPANASGLAQPADDRPSCDVPRFRRSLTEGAPLQATGLTPRSRIAKATSRERLPRAGSSDLMLQLKRARAREHGLWHAASHLELRVADEDRPSEAAAAQRARSVAMAIFLGLLIDGVPEGLLMGFLAAEGRLMPVLVVSLLMANFPEAFSSASLLTSAGMSSGATVGMWTGLCVLVGCLSGISCTVLLAAFPHFGVEGVELPSAVPIGVSLTEGLAGGAMLACIASVMLPESFERGKNDRHALTSSGFLCTSGFLTAVLLKMLCS